MLARLQYVFIVRLQLLDDMYNRKCKKSDSNLVLQGPEAEAAQHAIYGAQS
jgi:hypothetical protein